MLAGRGCRCGEGIYGLKSMAENIIKNYF